MRTKKGNWVMFFLLCDERCVFLCRSVRKHDRKKEGKKE